MKEVRVCEAMKSPVGTSSDGTVLHQQDGGTKSRQVPIWEKSNLTLEEAAAYSGIGINKLREITNEDKCKFVLWVGNKRLIKRRLFDCFYRAGVFYLSNDATSFLFDIGGNRMVGMVY